MASKVFEVGDVLPQGTIRVSWPYGVGGYHGTRDFIKAGSYVYFEVYGYDPEVWFYGPNGILIAELYEGSWENPYTNESGNHAYIDIDTTSLTLSERTITQVDYSFSDYNFSWEQLQTGYSITFDSNGGTTIPDIEEATELPTPLPTPTKSGYTFVAWYYESDFQTRAKAGDAIESNVTLYAKWHNLGSLFTEIADAIRSKDGTSENIRDVDFGERVKQIQGPKEEQTKTVSPTTSSQDVLPDANKVLSKVTVNAIPTETKSQQPNLSSGDQTINATSGKFMTSFTITKDTTNHIASNIRSGITLYGVTGNLQPAKEEETKTITPDFSSGNVVVTPTSGKVMSQVTINKDSNLIAENIKKDVTVHGITGTLESGGITSGLVFTPDYQVTVGTGDFNTNIMFLVKSTIQMSSSNDYFSFVITPYGDQTQQINIVLTPTDGAFGNILCKYRYSSNSGSSWSNFTNIVESSGSTLELTKIGITIKSNTNTPYFSIKYGPDNTSYYDGFIDANTGTAASYSYSFQKGYLYAYSVTELAGSEW